MPPLSTEQPSPMAKFYYCLPLLVAALACSGAQAHPRAPSPSPSPSQPSPSLPPGPDCMSSFLNMTGCLSYVAKGSNDTTPGSECCQELSGTYDSNPICLCVLLAGGTNSIGISIDDGRALKLPSLCNLGDLSPSLCTEIGIPIPSPSSFGSSPSPSPGSGPRLPGPGSSPSPSPGSGPRLPGPGSTAAPPEANFAIKTSSVNLFVLVGLSVIVFIIELF